MSKLLTKEETELVIQKKYDFMRVIALSYGEMKESDELIKQATDLPLKYSPEVCSELEYLVDNHEGRGGNIALFFYIVGYYNIDQVREWIVEVWDCEFSRFYDLINTCTDDWGLPEITKLVENHFKSCYREELWSLGI